MPVNLTAPNPSDLHPVPGVKLGIAMAGIRNRTNGNVEWTGPSTAIVRDAAGADPSIRNQAGRTPREQALERHGRSPSPRRAERSPPWTPA